MTVLSVKPVNKSRAFNDFDRLFNEFFNSNMPAAPQRSNGLNSKPAVNVIENGENFQIQLAAPGLEKTDFHIDVDKDILSIEVHKTFNEEENQAYKRREFGYFEFKRSFRLPESVAVDGIEASYVNGILSILLPKKDEAKVKPPRKVAIQ